MRFLFSAILLLSLNSSALSFSPSLVLRARVSSNPSALSPLALHPSAPSTHAIRTPAISKPATRCPALRAMDEDYSEQIVQAEANATPLRPIRLQLYTGVGILSAALGVAMVLAYQGNVEAAKGLADSVPRVLTREITEGLSFALPLLCGYFFYAEEETRKANLKRIAERLEERKLEVIGANRTDRRSREKQFGKGKKRVEPKAISQEPSQEVSVATQPPAAEEVSAKDSSASMMDKVKDTDFFKEASDLGKAQALQLNTMLEDAGVLEPVVTKPKKGSVKASAKKAGSKGTKGKKKKKSKK